MSEAQGKRDWYGEFIDAIRTQLFTPVFNIAEICGLLLLIKFPPPQWALAIIVLLWLFVKSVNRDSR